MANRYLVIHYWQAVPLVLGAWLFVWLCWVGYANTHATNYMTYYSGCIEAELRKVRLDLYYSAYYDDSPCEIRWGLKFDHEPERYYWHSRGVLRLLRRLQRGEASPEEVVAQMRTRGWDSTPTPCDFKLPRLNRR